jgi:hypothetical protein
LSDLARGKGPWATAIGRSREGLVVDESIVFTFKGGDVKSLTIESDEFTFEKVVLQRCSVSSSVV